PVGGGTDIEAEEGAAIDERNRQAGGLAGPAPGRAGAVPVARRLLPRPLPDRSQDQPVADDHRPAALCAGARSGRRPAGLARVPLRPLARELRLAPRRPALSLRLPQEPRGRRPVHPDPAGPRLCARLWPLARATAAAAAADDPGGAAVLDVVPDPRLRLDQHPPARRPAQPGARRAWARRRAAGVAVDRHRDLYRHRLFVPAV